MSISIDNVSHTETGQTLLLATNRKLHAGFRSTELHLTLEHSDGQCQGQFQGQCQGQGQG